MLCSTFYAFAFHVFFPSSRECDLFVELPPFPYIWNFYMKIVWLACAWLFLHLPHNSSSLRLGPIFWALFLFWNFNRYCSPSFVLNFLLSYILSVAKRKRHFEFGIVLQKCSPSFILPSYLFSGQNSKYGGGKAISKHLSSICGCELKHEPKSGSVSEYQLSINKWDRFWSKCRRG